MRIRINGQAITDGLRAFNSWRDDFLIELSTLFLMIGFVAGTVDVLTSDGLSQVQWFNIAWAIVQAIAIDGLFFAVWGKIRRATWSRATWPRSLALIAVGLLLAIVASLVNGLLSYQELNQIADVRIAMARLGIDQAAFTYARAILVVLVSILVALFCREATTTEQPVAPTVAQVTQVTAMEPVALSIPRAIPEQATAIAHSPEQATQENSPVAPGSLKATSQKTSVSRSPKQKATQGEATDDSYVAHDSQATNDRDGLRATDSPEEIDHIVIISSPVRDRIKKAMIDNPGAGYQAIAHAADCGYSTVKKHAQGIRHEISA